MNMKTLTETSTFRVLSLLLCFCFFIPAMNVSASSLQADKFKVSGIVKDATGEPVIGASVVEKGTTNGTVTDLDFFPHTQTGKLLGHVHGFSFFLKLDFTIRSSSE